MLNKLEKNARDIYLSIGVNGQGMSRDLAKKRIPLILENNIKEFILYNFNNYDCLYNESLLASLPELWQNFTLYDWENIIQSTRIDDRIPREDNYDDIDKYPDVVFLYKYLEIDSIQLFLNTASVRKNEKLAFLNFFRKYGIKLIKDHWDLELLDDGTFASRKIFSDAKEELKRQGARMAKTDIEDLRNYVDFLLTQIT